MENFKLTLMDRDADYKTWGMNDGVRKFWLMQDDAGFAIACSPRHYEGLEDEADYIVPVPIWFGQYLLGRGSE